MILNYCGISIRRFEREDIEMVRIWRNDPKITKHMFYQEHITPEMQKSWFDSLSNNDYYFIIEKDEIPLGLISLAFDSLEERSAYAGLFIYEESYWGTQIPVLASLALLRFAFDDLDLALVKARVQKENKVARRYNEQLGFKRLSDEVQQLEAKTYYSKLTGLIAHTARTFSQ